MEHETGELLSNLAVTIPSLRSEVGMLSGGQRQQVAVARSLLGEPKVVMLDEPTAALGVPQTRQVLELIRRLRERDLGVLVISHNLVDVFAVADRIFVLRLGHAAGEFRASETNEDQVVAAITGLGDNGGRQSADSSEPARAGRNRRTRRPEADTVDEEAEHRPSAGETLRRIIQGDLSSFRVVFGLIVIAIIFQVQESRFLSAENLTNLMLQITTIGLISVGIVYVLLLGEIDLSVGAVSGLCGAVMAVLNVKHGWNAYMSIAAAIAVGAAIGCLQGTLFSRFVVPSFVVTLAGLLTWEGALLQVLGKTGSLNITDPKITGLANIFYSNTVGWIIASVVIVAYGAVLAIGFRRRVAAGLNDRNPLAADLPIRR